MCLYYDQFFNGCYLSASKSMVAEYLNAFCIDDYSQQINAQLEELLFDIDYHA